MPSNHHTLVLTELRAVLTRHLPVGMEGVADAQSRAAMEVVSRRDGNPQVKGPSRQALLMLRDVALGHRASSMLLNTNSPCCVVCRNTPASDDFAAWPCPIWAVAEMLGVVTSDGSDFEVANDPMILAGNEHDETGQPARDASESEQSHPGGQMRIHLPPPSKTSPEDLPPRRSVFSRTRRSDRR